MLLTFFRCMFPTVAALLLVFASPAAGFSLEIDVFFSPNGRAATSVATEISKAEKSILCQTYAISESQITTALLDAHRRGVDVQLIVDKHQQNDKYSSAPRLHSAGIHTVCDRVEALHHNKVMIIDGHTVVTGSMNFTTAGDKRNAENTLIIHDAAIAALFTDNWKFHAAHSSSYTVTHSRDFKPKPLPPNLIPPLTPRPHKDSLLWHAFPVP